MKVSESGALGLPEGALDRLGPTKRAGLNRCSRHRDRAGNAAPGNLACARRIQRFAGRILGASQAGGASGLGAQGRVAGAPRRTPISGNQNGGGCPSKGQPPPSRNRQPPQHRGEGLTRSTELVDRVRRVEEGLNFVCKTVMTALKLLLEDELRIV